MPSNDSDVGHLGKPPEVPYTKENLNDEACRRFVAELFEVKIEKVIPGVSTAIETVLKSLQTSEQKVIVHRFRLLDSEYDGRFQYRSKYPTYEKVGERIGYTKQRVWQLFQNSIKKLRHPAQSRVLMPFVTVEVHPEQLGRWKPHLRLKPRSPSLSERLTSIHREMQKLRNKLKR